MSLRVSKNLIKSAREGKLAEKDFYTCVKSSLPFAVKVIHNLVHQADQSTEDMAEFAPRTLETKKRAELLRATASTAIRNMLQKHFVGHQGKSPSIRIAFQNCHKVGVFLETERGIAAFEKWTSSEEQILAQSPSSVHC